MSAEVSLTDTVVSWVGSGCIQDNPVHVVSAKATFFLEDRLQQGGGTTCWCKGSHLLGGGLACAKR